MVTSELSKSATLDRSLARMFKNFYHLWRVLEELRMSPSPEALLEEWRSSPKPSQEWRCAQFYEQAVDVLSVSLNLPRELVEELLRQRR
jgi:hypothetical protein